MLPRDHMQLRNEYMRVRCMYLCVPRPFGEIRSDPTPKHVGIAARSKDCGNVFGSATVGAGQGSEQKWCSMVQHPFPVSTIESRVLPK